MGTGAVGGRQELAAAVLEGVHIDPAAAGGIERAVVAISGRRQTITPARSPAS
jgi:hypothetical protein